MVDVGVWLAIQCIHYQRRIKPMYTAARYALDIILYIHVKHDRSSTRNQVFTCTCTCILNHTHTGEW